MTKPRQREQLFDSEAEKQAEILEYKKQELRIAKIQLTLTSQLANLKAQREMVARRIQELQNLDIFDDREEK